MKITLTNGTEIHVKDDIRHECKCGAGKCPFLDYHEWESDSISQFVWTWHCTLEGEEDQFMFDPQTREFDSQRTKKCLALDPLIEIRMLAEKPYRSNLRPFSTIDYTRVI